MSRGCGLDEDELEAAQAQPATEGSRGGCGEASRSSIAGCGDTCVGVTPLQAHRQRSICIKCKSRTAEVAARQHEPLCRHCLFDGLLTRVKSAVRANGLIQPGDRVVAAVTGGPSSMAMLHLLRQLQNPDDRRLQRGKIAFELEVVHVEEGAALGLSDADSAAAADAVRGCVAAACADDGAAASPAFRSVPLEDVFCSAAELVENTGDAGGRRERRQRLQRLLQALSDPTGREDLTAALRRQLLLAAAQRHRCQRLALGDSASLLAVRTISLAAKGAGYALPGEIQYLDARRGATAPAVILPVRDLGARDLALLCHFLHIPLAPPPVLPAAAKGSINALAAAFVAGLQADLPSAVSTIVRTADKLQAFPWNETSRGPVRHGNDGGVGPMCGLCQAPLTPAEVQELLAEAASPGGMPQHGQNGAACDGTVPLQDHWRAFPMWRSCCCHSCRHQVLPSLQRAPEPAAGGVSDASTSETEPQPLLPEVMLERVQFLMHTAQAAHGRANGASQSSESRLAKEEGLRQRLAGWLIEPAGDAAE